MSPALAEIVRMSDQLAVLAEHADWDQMLALAAQRQQQLERYFDQATLPDSPALIEQTLTAIQQRDQQLSVNARKQRDQLLSDAIDLRQRWQMSDTYQRVQNLQP